jgi:hypothetical protein
MAYYTIKKKKKRKLLLVPKLQLGNAKTAEAPVSSDRKLELPAD